MDLTRIATFAADGSVHVVVEAPRGAALKLKYEPAWETMGVSRPLPAGVVFPYDWGFIPSTLAEDGDPLDAMLLWDVASYPGVVIECRVIGVLQVEQNRTNHDPSARVRNDRVLCVPAEARREADLLDIVDLGGRVRNELEEFTRASTALEGKDVRVVGWADAAAALALVRQTMVDG